MTGNMIKNIMSRCSLEGIITDIYLTIMIVIFPFFFTNNYINIVQSKKFFFEAVSLMYIFTMLLAMLISKEDKQLSDSDTPLEEGNALVSKSRFLWAGLMVVALCISTLAGNDTIGDIYSYKGRMLDVSFMLICIAVYILFPAGFRLSGWLFVIFAISSVSNSSLIIMNNFGIDVLNMKSNLLDTQHYMFTGTMGNINVNASFLSLIIPVMYGVMYVEYEHTRLVAVKMLLMAGCVVSTVAVVCVRSDSVYLGVISVFVIITVYTFMNTDRLKNYLLCVLAMFMGFLLAGVSLWMFGEYSYDIGHLNEIMTGRYALAAMFIYVVIVYMLSRFLHNEKTAETRKSCFGKNGKSTMAVKVVALVCAILVIVCVFYCLMNMTDSFGNNRGYVWKRTVSMIVKEGPLFFITGHGMTSFGHLFESYYYDEMSAKYSLTFIDAHNELLQFVVTIGIIGTVGYYGMMLSEMIHGVKTVCENRYSLVCVLVTVSYIAQGLVNNPQVFTTPLIFIFMGVVYALRGSQNG